MVGTFSTNGGPMTETNGWGLDDAGMTPAQGDELVHPPVFMAWIATAVLLTSALFIPLRYMWALFIPLRYMWLGYVFGVVATTVCMVTTLVDRQRQASPNYVSPPGLQVQQRVRIVRIAAFLVCLVHILMLAQVAAQ